MELNFIKIENSFNKKDSSSTELKDFSSTKSQDVQNPVIVNSQTMSSITAGQIENNNFTKNIFSKKSFMRDILVGTIGTILGAIVTYFILGIK